MHSGGNIRLMLHLSVNTAAELTFKQKAQEILQVMNQGARERSE